jgi:hypothetical protein
MGHTSNEDEANAKRSFSVKNTSVDLYPHWQELRRKQLKSLEKELSKWMDRVKEVVRDAPLRLVKTGGGQLDTEVVDGRGSREASSALPQSLIPSSTLIVSCNQRDLNVLSY